MKAGNLSYYFTSKEDLIRQLLEAITKNYEDLTDEIRNDPKLSPEEQLAAFIRLVLRDLTSKETTRIFPDLWAAANHEEFYQDRLNEIYASSRSYVSSLVGQINPALSQDEQEAVALFMQASMEGLTVFAGYGKLGCDRIDWLSRVAQQSFIDYVKNAQPGQISGVPSSESRKAGSVAISDRSLPKLHRGGATAKLTADAGKPGPKHRKPGPALTKLDQA